MAQHAFRIEQNPVPEEREEKIPVFLSVKFPDGEEFEIPESVYKENKDEIADILNDLEELKNSGNRRHLDKIEFYKERIRSWL